MDTLRCWLKGDVFYDKDARRVEVENYLIMWFVKKEEFLQLSHFVHSVKNLGMK